MYINNFVIKRKLCQNILIFVIKVYYNNLIFYYDNKGVENFDRSTLGSY